MIAQSEMKTNSRVLQNHAKRYNVLSTSRLAMNDKLSLYACFFSPTNQYVEVHVLIEHY